MTVFRSALSALRHGDSPKTGPLGSDSFQMGSDFRVRKNNRCDFSHEKTGRLGVGIIWLASMVANLTLKFGMG